MTITIEQGKGANSLQKVLECRFCHSTDLTPLDFTARDAFPVTLRQLRAICKACGRPQDPPFAWMQDVIVRISDE